MLTIFINALVLFALISKFAPDDNPVGSRRILAITVAAGLLQAALDVVSTKLAWGIVMFLGPALLVWLALTIWCRLPRTAAFKIAALSTAANLTIAILLVVVGKRIFGNSD